MSHLNSQLESFGNEIINAIVSDITNPEFLAYAKETAITIASQLLGVNLNNAFIRPYVEAWIDDQIEKYGGSLVGIAAMIKSDPPKSVDAATEIVKETVNSTLDDFSSKLKERLQTKGTE